MSIRTEGWALTTKDSNVKEADGYTRSRRRRQARPTKLKNTATDHEMKYWAKYPPCDCILHNPQSSDRNSGYQLNYKIGGLEDGAY